MKIGIWSDLHLGKRQYRTDENGYNKYEMQGYKAFQKNIDIFKENKVDLIINAGDTFETPNPNVLAINKYVTGMEQLKDIPTMCILGNHDFNIANRKSNCSAVEIAKHTYLAQYDLDSVEINNILFVLMPYRYDTDENIKKYLQKCKEIVTNSNCSKKILVAHGVTDNYAKNSIFGDKLQLPDELVECFNLVIIGHIHTPFEYKQGKTLVISPGALIDYQAYEDRTGPIILDTDTMDFKRIKVKTPHIKKFRCNEIVINRLLDDVTEDIYHITYEGDISKIDNDLFIKAKNKTVNIVIDIINQEKEEEEKENENRFNKDIFKWVEENYPDYIDNFIAVREEVS